MWYIFPESRTVLPGITGEERSDSHMDPNPLESRTVFLDQEERRAWGQEASIHLTASGSGRFHSLLSPQRRLLYHDLILLKKYDIIYKKALLADG